MQLINEMLVYPEEVGKNQCYMFTANSTLTHNGELVMVADSALDFKKAYPNTPKGFGRRIMHLTQFNALFTLQDEGVIGALQTKYHWKEESPLELVETSLEILKGAAHKNPDYTFHLPFPGIGKDGLSIEQVMPLVEKLPDNVRVYLDAR